MGIKNCMPPKRSMAKERNTTASDDDQRVSAAVLSRQYRTYRRKGVVRNRVGTRIAGTRTNREPYAGRLRDHDQDYARPETNWNKPFPGRFRHWLVVVVLSKKVPARSNQN